jgi:hypothetical protein
MDRSTNKRLEEIAGEIGRLQGEKERLTISARHARENGQLAIERRDLIRLGILDVRLDTLVRERMELLRATQARTEEAPSNTWTASWRAPTPACC